ncbi:MAG: plasmid pRiA4b ORF-3 family protein [Candidatus Eisenbacteria bacterium]|nr:plasmid pRiA4b ORF-3 family protein [Candidatus Eisenbacteria bacterium]
MKRPASIFGLKVTLRDTRPPIWRRIRIRSDVTLFKLHSVLQYVMGWMDGHMHQFVMGETRYGKVDREFPECENEKKVMLSQVLRSPNDSLVYEYDFGDGWEHSVVLEQVMEAEPGGKYPYVVEGKRACPPEDCGGIGGYEHLLKVLADPRHPEHVDMVEWVGGSFDPEAFDAGEINRGFHGGWYLPPSPDAPRSKTALPRQTKLKLTAPRRRR